MEELDDKQQAFWEDLLFYVRKDMEWGRDPTTYRTLTVMVGEDYAKWEKARAENGMVRLGPGSKPQLKSYDDLRPQDAVGIMHDIEDRLDEVRDRRTSVAGLGPVQYKVPSPGKIVIFDRGPEEPKPTDLWEELLKSWQSLRDDWPR